MNNSRKFGGAAPIGGTTLLIIFAILCLIVFALLCITTARAGEILTAKSVEMTRGYYEADAAAEKILAELRAGIMPAEVVRKDNLYSYACPISDTHILAVVVRIAGDIYEILSWQSVPSVDWNADDSMKLWSGELP